MFKVKNPGLFAAGMGMLAGATPQQGFANAMSAYGTMDQVRHRREQEAFRRQQMAQAAAMEQQQRQQQQQAQNATLEFLRGKVPEDQFQLAQANPQVRLELFKRAMGGNAAEQAKFGLSPVMGVDANGNPVMMQMSNQGGVKPVELPEGVKIQNKPIEIDAGTHTILLDSITRQQVGMIPKNLAQAEAEKATGKAAGVAAAAMPAAKGRKDTVIELTDAVLAHPSLSAAVGPIDGMMPTFRGQTRDFESRVEQLRSEAFMAAREDLRGGGQITDFEGRKAEQALNRASLATDEASFRLAMTEFKERVERGYQLLEMQAQMGSMQGQQATPAQSGGLGVGQSVEVEPGITITKVR